jgi:hypothetical protein
MIVISGQRPLRFCEKAADAIEYLKHISKSLE